MASMWYDGLMARVLRSRLHRLLSSSTLLVTLTGRKSGAQLTTPSSYQRDGAMLWTLSYRHRKWWRNLRGGATVTLRLQGRAVSAQADVLESREQVTDGLSAYLRRTPQIAKHLGVRLDQERAGSR